MPVIGRIIDMPVIGGDKRCKIPNIHIAYITVHYSAVFLVTLYKMCFYISIIALNDARVYFI